MTHVGKPYVPRKDTPWEGTGYVLSGTCLCGHSYLDHHDGSMAKSMGGSPAECEFYGSNETGGTMPNPSHSPDVNRRIHHCSTYCDVEEPDPRRLDNWRRLG